MHRSSQMSEFDQNLASLFGPVPDESVNPNSQNTLIVALDDSSISGPEAGLRDMEGTIRTVINNNGVNAVLGFYGMFRAYKELIGDTPEIMNLTLSTVDGNHLRKTQVSSVQQAVDVGAEAVSVHVNTTSPWEGEMLRILGQTVELATQAERPVLVHTYPRTIRNGKEDHYEQERKEDPDKYTALVRKAVRIAADLGASVIKAPYTGSTESFATVVESAYGLPVVTAGGTLGNIPAFLEAAHSSIEAGARGIAVGRNFFKQPLVHEREIILLALYMIVHRGHDAETAAMGAELHAIARRAKQLEASGDPLWGMHDEGMPRSFLPFPRLHLLTNNETGQQVS